MRILAIRGRNLASLAREFALELAAPPLRDAGLFAITGPVGAGKTTLLDAVCLALFDRTPRLCGRGGAVIGSDDRVDDELGSNDVRTVLRRDAADGFAEVEFRGRDGRRYRSRWSVRRARQRADGRLQVQELALYDLDAGGVRIGGGRRSEVLAAIEQRLGLSFDQFRRSVLLAQGDFAAFLQASPAQRAQLLEKLTGAELYRRLSIAAFARSKAERERLDKLQAQFDAHNLRSPEQRAGLQAEMATALRDRQACDLGIEAAQRHLSWHAQAAQQEQAESEAVVALQQAEAAYAATADRRTELARLRRALPFVPQWLALTAATAQAAAAATEQVAVAALLAQAQRRAAAAQTAFAAAWTAATAAPVPAAAPMVVTEFARWQDELVLLADKQQRAAVLAQASAGLVQAEAAAQREQQAGADGQRDALEQRSRAQAAVASARAQLALPVFANLAERRRALAAAGHRLRERRSALAAWTVAMAADTAARSSLREILAERELLVAAAAPLLAARTAAEQQLQQRQRTAEELRRTAALAAHRSALVEGQPCPLCGALEHPAAGGDVRPELAQALAAVADAERMFAAAGSALAKNQADQKAMLRTIAGAQQRAEREGAACRAAEQAWRELAADDATLADRAPDALGAALATAGKQLAATAAAVEAEDERQQVVTVVLTTAVTAAAQADHDWEQATVRLQQQQAAARAAVAVRQAAVAEAAALAAAIDERTLLIGPAFGPVTDWQARLSRGSEAFVRALAAAARAHLVATASDAEMLRLRQQLAAAEQAATVQQTTAAAAQQQLAADLAAAAVERADVLLAQQTSTAAFDDATTAMAELATAVATARAVVQERVARRRQHQRTGRPELDAQEAGAALEEIRSARDVIDQRLAAAQGELLVDDHARRQRAELQPVLAAQRQRLQIWRALDDLIGSSTGDAFGVFAQSLTMDLLLAEANRRLAELARRYRLQRLRATDLDFGVLDLDLGGSLRSVRTLSGGESFLVSLALALALASLAAERTRIETLFLDEGFGTLDGASLETALAALDALQATGCQVGIISHVDSLAERIGVVVQVQPDGAGQSRVIVGA